MRRRRGSCCSASEHNSASRVDPERTVGPSPNSSVPLIVPHLLLGYRLPSAKLKPSGDGIEQGCACSSPLISDHVIACDWQPLIVTK